MDRPTERADDGAGALSRTPQPAHPGQELAELGPFFALAPWDPRGGWQPLTALMQGPALAERVTHAQSFLSRLVAAPVESRVAASVMSLGLFARLLSPYVGAAALDIPLPAPDPHRTFWQAARSGPWPLALTGPAQPVELGAALSALVMPVAEHLGAEYSVSSKILRGNAASAVVGAVTMIATSRPDLRTRADQLATALLSGPLTGTGTVGGRFVRRSCCLYYRVPGGGFCGDCPLAQRPRIQ